MGHYIQGTNPLIHPALPLPPQMGTSTFPIPKSATNVNEDVYVGVLKWIDVYVYVYFEADRDSGLRVERALGEIDDGGG